MCGLVGGGLSPVVCFQVSKAHGISNDFCLCLMLVDQMEALSDCPSAMPACLPPTMLLAMMITDSNSLEPSAPIK